MFQETENGASVSTAMVVVPCKKETEATAILSVEVAEKITVEDTVELSDGAVIETIGFTVSTVEEASSEEADQNELGEEWLLYSVRIQELASEFPEIFSSSIEPPNRLAASVPKAEKRRAVLLLVVWENTPLVYIKVLPPDLTKAIWVQVAGEITVLLT